MILVYIYIYIYIYIYNPFKNNKNRSHLDYRFISILLWVLIWINNTKIILSIRSEEVLLFLVLLIHINTHNKMEINL